MSDNRLYVLIKALSDQYQTAECFAEKLHVSSKTIRNLLKELDKEIKYHGAGVKSKASVGYRLEVYNQDLWDQFFLTSRQQFEQLGLPQSHKERIQYILEYLSHRKEYIRIDDLSETLYVAKRTLTNDIKEIEEILQKYQIKLIRRPKHGIKIEGKEVNLRLCLANYVAQNSLTKIIQGRSMDVITECVLSCLEKSGYHLSDVAIQSLIVHLFIAVKRIETDHYVLLEEEWLTVIYGQEAYNIAKDIIGKIQDKFQLTFPESEVRYAALHLAGKRTLGDESSDNIVIDHETSEIVIQMLRSVYEAFKFDFSGDLELRMALCQHLIPLKVRVQCGMNFRNPLLKDIKERFALAYAMASQASSIIADRYQKLLKDDEIGYIALSFALALERQNRKREKKNILLVCSSGKGSAKLLAYQYQEKFKDQIKKVRTSNVNSVANVDFSDIDYIFTTVPIAAKVPVPIMEIKYFLDDQDIKVMKKALAQGPSGICERYFSPEIFIAEVPTGSREEILDFMCRHIKKYQELPENFLEAILKREKLARTAFGNRVAMPHPYKALTRYTFVCVGILKKPVWWDDKEVQVVFLVSIGQQPDKELQKFYRVTSKFLLNKEGITELIKKKSYSALQQLLAEVENELEE